MGVITRPGPPATAWVMGNRADPLLWPPASPRCMHAVGQPLGKAEPQRHPLLLQTLLLQ